MPHELRFRPEALADLEDIDRSVRRASGSAMVGRRYIARVLERCRHIATLPYAGRPRDDLAPGLRTVPFERRLVIAYRVVEPGVVEITNVFYGASDYAALYRRQSDDSAGG
jgi:toxin ParE1/3/4